ncbi:MAG TPA: helix-turn-helix domain-containing protein [Terriglobales bacterium]|nr:helix-turn-helix domain-containing protein [Terriglobales bacterium]
MARIFAQLPPIAVRPAAAATMIGCTRRSVDRLLASGALPSVRIGGMRLIRVRDIHALLRSDRPHAITGPPAGEVGR